MWTLRARRPVGLFLLLLALGALACSPGAERPRNVLLLVVDTLRADRLGCYGYPRPTSPNIDALAARGTLYERNYSQASWTVPSMISMLTGVSVTTEEQTIPASLPTLAEVLQARGMETVAFPANEVLGHGRGFERGLDLWDFTNETVNADGGTLARRFEEWHGGRAAENGGKQPWFAWVQFLDPHMPYKPKPAFDVFRGPRPGQERLEARWRAAEQEALGHAGESSKDLAASMEMMTHYSNLYDGEVRQVDDAIGRILATLEAAGELEETLVLVVSDHGEMLFEQRLQPIFVKATLDKHQCLPSGVADLFGNGHRSWFFEDLWETPMIVAGPGMPRGKRVHSLSANLDVFPTILEALDLPRSPWLEGESHFGGGETERSRVLAYAYETSAVREAGGLKLVEHPPKMYLLPETAERPVDLFDLAADPHEETNRAPEQPADAARLRGEIQSWLERSRRESVTTMTQAQIDALRANGYIDGK